MKIPQGYMASHNFTGLSRFLFSFFRKVIFIAEKFKFRISIWVEEGWIIIQLHWSTTFVFCEYSRGKFLLSSVPIGIGWQTLDWIFFLKSWTERAKRNSGSFSSSSQLSIGISLDFFYSVTRFAELWLTFTEQYKFNFRDNCGLYSLLWLNAHEEISESRKIFTLFRKEKNVSITCSVCLFVCLCLRLPSSGCIPSSYPNRWHT